ncbi:hypothetical protein GCM10027344_36130 [Spelaeicoccus albus]
MHERLGPGPDDDAVRDERPEMFGRHMLVIECQHIDVAREFAQGRQIGVIPDRCIWNHLGRAHVWALGKYLETDAECFGCRCQHARELSAAYDSNYRKYHESKVYRVQGTVRHVRTSD